MNIRTLVAAAALFASAPAMAQLRVVTSSTDLYDIAVSVGGDKIKATHIEQGYQDPHFVESKPSFILQLQKADIFAFVGLELEVGWMGPLIDGARNPKIRPGGSGYLDVSKAIDILDVPKARVDRSQGDVHPYGNPHYWLDPDNGRKIARLFQQKFTALDKANAAVYERNAKAFVERLDAAEKTWAPLIAQIKGKPVVAWHTSWRYFAEYNGMKLVAFMEPKPGVPPSASHLASVIAKIKETGAKAIVMEPFYDKKVGEMVAKQTGARLLILPTSVEGVKEAKDYIQLITYNLTQLANATK
jgi:zinc/manganese transport system substrate-binding protein